MSRVVRGLAALVALVAVLVGVPVALVALGGDPVPDAFHWAAVLDALRTPDDGTLLVRGVALIGWAAWVLLVLSLLAELVTLASRQRLRIRLPGLGGPQRVVSGLLLTVVGLLAAPQLPAAPARPPTAQAAPRTPAAQPEREPAAVPRPAPAAHRRVHVVQQGDDLWTLAEHYYDDGRQWRRIAAANPTLLTGGPDRLRPGWRLVVPDDGEPSARPGGRTVTVRTGDTLSALAERELGSADRWPALYEVNRAVIADPDELDVGLRLVVPGADGHRSRGRAEPDRAAGEQSAPRSAANPGPPSSGPPGPPEPLDPPERLDPSGRLDQPEPTEPPASRVPTPVPAGPAASGVAEDLAAAPLVAVGGLLAAGLIGGLRTRRRLQLQARPVGRRIVHPPVEAQAVEAALGRRQQPLGLRSLDKAMRAISATCRADGSTPPELELVRVSEAEIELLLRGPAPPPPVGFTVRGRSWVLSRDDVGYLSTVPGLGDALRPWPALVTLGRDEQERLVLADLEGLRLLAVSGDDDPAGILAAMAVELSFSPWADEMVVTLVGGDGRLPGALGKHNVTQTTDVDALLDHVELRARAQRKHHPDGGLGRRRIDPELADPWAPEIVLVDQPLTSQQQQRLLEVVHADPPVTVAAVLVGDLPASRWSLRTGAGSGGRAALEPVGTSLVPQRLQPRVRDAVVALVDATGRADTLPAPWWRDVATAPDPPPDNVTYLNEHVPREIHPDAEGGAMKPNPGSIDQAARPPMLQLLGPVELLDAAGPPPPRAAKQCLEYCAWLLEHPGTTAQAMMSALAVAEGTRRSNMSRLRSWLGAAPDGTPYLPDAYTGRIVLEPTVTSDWQRVQILTAAGVNRTADAGLRAVLDLVRGAPLADAAPYQWHWAEELRTDMISCVRDVGVELAGRALAAGDLELARFAAARALVAAPGDERLIAVRIRTEHLAGNDAETERLTLQLAAQARALGLDLDPETVTLLQEVMEGRVRARLA